MSLSSNVMSLADDVYCRRSRSYCCDRYNHAAVCFAHGKPFRTH